MLNHLGVYHFGQIAGWSAEEIAWVDANLEGFKGRVSRDDWVSQAKVLAAGGDTEFSARVGKGGGLLRDDEWATAQIKARRARGGLSPW